MNLRPWLFVSFASLLSLPSYSHALSVRVLARGSEGWVSPPARISLCRGERVQLNIEVNDSDPNSTLTGYRAWFLGGYGHPIMTRESNSQPASVNRVPGYVWFKATKTGTFSVGPITAQVEGSAETIDFPALAGNVVKANRLVGTYGTDVGISGTTDNEVVSFWRQESGGLVNEVKLRAQLSAQPMNGPLNMGWAAFLEDDPPPPGYISPEIEESATDPTKAKMIIHSPGTYLVTSYCGKRWTDTMEKWPPKIRVHAVAVTGVRWLEYYNSLSWNPGSRLLGDKGVGLRMFAEREFALDPASTGSRVYVEAQITPKLPGIPIHFRGFDPDDPSHNSGPCDPDVEGNDNRDNGVRRKGIPSIATKTTGRQGRAAILIKTPRQPGDNLIFAACTTRHTRNRLLQRKRWLIRDGLRTPLNEDADHPEGTLAAAVTVPLTIWRTGHVEVDGMTKVAGNHRKATVDIVLPLDSGQGYEVALRQEIADEEGQLSRFENGRMVEEGPGGRTYEVVSNKRRSAVLKPHPAGPPNDGARVVFYDDDKLKNGASLPLPDLTHAKKRFLNAYIRLESFEDGKAPFGANYPSTLDTSKDETEYYRFDRIGERASDYWVVYALGAYQDETVADADPNSEDAWFGCVDEIRGLGASVFSETMWDRIPDAGLWQTKWERVLTHELGHLWGAEHEDGGIMEWTGYPYFTAESLARIRSTKLP